MKYFFVYSSAANSNSRKPCGTADFKSFREVAPPTMTDDALKALLKSNNYNSDSVAQAIQNSWLDVPERIAIAGNEWTTVSKKKEVPVVVDRRPRNKDSKTISKATNESNGIENKEHGEKLATGPAPHGAGRGAGRDGGRSTTAGRGGGGRADRRRTFDKDTSNGDDSERIYDKTKRKVYKKKEDVEVVEEEIDNSVVWGGMTFVQRMEKAEKERLKAIEDAKNAEIERVRIENEKAMEAEKAEKERIRKEKEAEKERVKAARKADQERKQGKKNAEKAIKEAEKAAAVSETATESETIPEVPVITSVLAFEKSLKKSEGAVPVKTEKKKKERKEKKREPKNRTEKSEKTVDKVGISTAEPSEVSVAPEPKSAVVKDTVAEVAEEVVKEAANTAVESSISDVSNSLGALGSENSPMIDSSPSFQFGSFTSFGGIPTSNATNTSNSSSSNNEVSELREHAQPYSKVVQPVGSSSANTNSSIPPGLDTNKNINQPGQSYPNSNNNAGSNVSRNQPMSQQQMAQMQFQHQRMYQQQAAAYYQQMQYMNPAMAGQPMGYPGGGYNPYNLGPGVPAVNPPVAGATPSAASGLNVPTASSNAQLPNNAQLPPGMQGQPQAPYSGGYYPHPNPYYQQQNPYYYGQNLPAIGGGLVGAGAGLYNPTGSRNAFAHQQPSNKLYNNEPIGSGASASTNTTPSSGTGSAVLTDVNAHLPYYPQYPGQAQNQQYGSLGSFGGLTVGAPQQAQGQGQWGSNSTSQQANVNQPNSGVGGAW